MKKDQKECLTKQGFTLPELMIAAFILMVSFAGVILCFVSCINLSEMSRNMSNASIAVRARMEQIKNTPFNQLAANYDRVTFTNSNLNGIGISYVDTTNPNLYEITVSFCWRQKNGRVVGEDKNLNGALNVGEDQDGDNEIDSIVQVMDYIYDE